ncbi:MAG TPA: hypothetical protein VGQ81_07735 [Acidobacteriota bacterium]|nr:hypothetical protein [Acidobacteriota bacterium]
MDDRLIPAGPVADAPGSDIFGATFAESVACRPGLQILAPRSAAAWQSKKADHDHVHVHERVDVDVKVEVLVLGFFTTITATRLGLPALYPTCRM